MSDVKFLKEKFIVIIFGPTGVGKSDFAEKLAFNLVKAQLVNCDVGQFYSKISIGTAKPDYKSSKIRQNLFDIIDEPKDFNVANYRNLVFNEIDKIWKEGEIPILVGGSGFYIKSLFFPPIEPSLLEKENKKEDLVLDIEAIKEDELWQALNLIDPERAKKISKNDIYRIKRALYLWKDTGLKPSELEPVFDLPCNFMLVFINRERNLLYEKIESRTKEMIKNGWIDEVKNLINSEDCQNWEVFFKRKKLIGYDLIIDYLKNKESNLQDLEFEIAKRTKNYAKRQITFWKSFEKQLKKEVEKNKYTNKVETVIEELILKHNQFEETEQVREYINRLTIYLKQLFN